MPDEYEDEYQETCGQCKHCVAQFSHRCILHNIGVDWETPACEDFSNDEELKDA
jgi:hypothetical protein